MKLFNIAKKEKVTAKLENEAAVDAGLLDPECFDDKKKKSLNSFLNKFNSSRYSYLFYAFIIPVILNYLVYLSMGLHPFGNGSVLVLDLNGQYVYFYEALRNAVYGETSLLYSFCRSLGGEFFGIYAYYVASPFSYIVCLFPQERILEALLTIFLLKAGITGMTMAYYLDRISSKLNRINVVIFSVLYAMCSYAIVQQHNSMWIDALMWLPLLTLGIESLIKEGKYKLFTSMLALILMSNFYIGYMSCIYTLIYFFYYYFSRNEKNRNNTMGEKNHFLRSLLRTGLFSVIGIGIAMVILITALYSLKFGKNTFSNPDFSFSFRFDLMDFFTRFLPGAYDTVRPEGLPFVYCGVLTLYCIPVYFFSKKFSVREKIFTFALMFLFFLCFSINTIDMIWHGFQKPNWLNYRYSFMLSFIMVQTGFRGFSEIKKVSGKTVAIMSACYIFFISIAQKFNFESYVDRISGTIEFDQKLEELNIIWLSLLCFALFAVLLCALIKCRDKKGIALVIGIFVCVEAFANAIACDAEFGEDVIYSTYNSYNDFISALRPACEEIIEEDGGFYRFEKTAHRKYCDNMALNIRGITCSTSTLNKATIEYLAAMGYASRSHWSKYLGGTLVNDSLIGMKYIIASEKDNLDLYYEKTDIEPTSYNNTTYYVYENPYALSLAFAVDDSVGDFLMTDSSPMLRLNRLVSDMLGEDEVLKLFFGLDYETTTANISSTTIAGHWKYTPIKEGSDATVTYCFTAKQDGEVFFYLPSDYAREVKVRVNGTDKGNFYASETTRIFSLGSFCADDEINLSLTLDADVLYVKQDVPSVFQLDTELAKSCLKRLAETQVEIEEGWTSTDLTGSVTTKKNDQLILTTLAYDEGWIVYVDGEEVPYEESLNALISFRIEDAGMHTVEFVYRPQCFVLGLLVSVTSISVFIFIIVFEKKLRLVLSRITDQGRKDHALADTETVDDYELYEQTKVDRNIMDMFTDGCDTEKTELTDTAAEEAYEKNAAASDKAEAESEGNDVSESEENAVSEPENKENGTK